MKLHTKPSALYADLRANPDILAQFVGSESLANNIIDLSLRSDEQLSKGVTRESALADQSEMIAHAIFVNFRDHVKNVRFHDIQKSEEITLATMVALVKDFEALVDYVFSDPTQFVTNFAKDPKEFDREYLLKQSGAKNDFEVFHTNYNTLTGIPNSKGLSSPYSLPDNFYLIGGNLCSYDNENSSINKEMYKDIAITPTLFFVDDAKPNAPVNPYMIDKNRGIFRIDEGSVRKLISDDDYTFSQIVDNRYAIFTDKDAVDFVVDMHHPVKTTQLHPVPEQYDKRKLSLEASIDNVVLVFESYTRDYAKTDAQSFYLFDKSGELSFRSLFNSKGYGDLLLVQESVEDPFFVIQARMKGQDIYHYYVVLPHGPCKQILTVGGEDIPLKNTSYGLTHPTYNHETKELSVRFSPDYGFWKSIANAIADKPKEIEKKVSLKGFLLKNPSHTLESIY